MNPRAHFSGSLMSDAKWRKLFEVAAEHSDCVSTAVWKLVDDEQPIQGNLPVPADVWETAVDGCLGGPVSYRQIEWLQVPRTVWYKRYVNAPLSSRVQDIETLIAALSKRGKFPIEVTEEGLLFRGYLSVA